MKLFEENIIELLQGIGIDKTTKVQEAKEVRRAYFFAKMENVSLLFEQSMSVSKT